MNEYDSDRLAQAFTDAGWQRADSEEEAEALILNTCTVRQLAEHKAFSLLGRWVKLKPSRPHLIVGMVGCLAQHIAEEAFRREPGLDFIAGPRALTRVPELAEAARGRKRMAETGDSGYGHGVGTAVGNTLVAAVGIMEGCDQFCTYCAVPRARGRETSRPMPNILAEVQRRVTAGAKEILLLGQNVNRYGRDLSPDEDFAALLGQVAAVPGVARLRFMTGHPHGFSERVIAAMTSLPPVCEALHLPVQSGSDRILKAMHRGYTAEEYLDLTRRLRAAVPSMVFTTDIIVGFPGETEADFQATLDLLQAVPADQAYCFKYSPRKGTPAAVLPDQVPQTVKEVRLERLLEVVRRLAITAQAALVGRSEPVLVEILHAKRAGELKGRTRSNRWVTFPGPEIWVGRELPIRIVAAEALTLLGEPECAVTAP
jgi:tRNA-2-methylthio-N6-dimethylallyladenosine synthase